MIAGVNIPDNKRINIALRYVYGIGPTIAEKIISQTNIIDNPKVKDLTENDLDKIRAVIDNSYTVEGDLRVERNLNIRRLIDIGSYKGTRHRKNLPANGQRTKTNARTKRGKKLAIAKRGRDTKQTT